MHTSSGLRRSATSAAARCDASKSPPSDISLPGTAASATMCTCASASASRTIWAKEKFLY